MDELSVVGVPTPILDLLALLVVLSILWITPVEISTFYEDDGNVSALVAADGATAARRLSGRLLKPKQGDVAAGDDQIETNEDDPHSHTMQ